MISPRLCRTLRPAPQAGCFVSRLSISCESQATCDSFVFGTVAVESSSGVTETPERAKARAKIKSKRGNAALVLRAGRTSLTRGQGFALARTTRPRPKENQAIRCFPRASKTRLMPSIMSSWTSASSSRAICFSCLWASFDK